MLDLHTLIIVNSVIFVTVSLLMVVSRWTLGSASAGALTWVVGDALLQCARPATLADLDLLSLPFIPMRLWHSVPSPVVVGVLLLVGFWWHLRALHRVEGQRTPRWRTAGESLGITVLWVVVALSIDDGPLRGRLMLVGMMVVAALTLPPAWRLARRFWGARLILLMLTSALVANSLRLTLSWHTLDPATPDELSKVMLFETMFGLTMTMAFLVLLQEQVRQQLVELSLNDPLTGLYNRRGLLSLLQRDLEQARRAKHPVSMVLFDLDHFKDVNDSVGHDAGDAVLRGFADRLRLTYRQSDLIGRWGGEEFVVVMPGTTAGQAASIAERVRAMLHRQPLAQGVGIVTVSGGVAQADLSLDVQATIKGLIATADRRMYEAKVSRDRVCSDDGTTARSHETAQASARMADKMEA
jgi:diguanylate cyclase (GGDEF)-like protein